MFDENGLAIPYGELQFTTQQNKFKIKHKAKLKVNKI